MHYDHNMQIMKEFRNNFYELFRTKQPEDSTLNIASVTTRVQEKALVVEKDGVEYRLNSKYNPIDEARKWAEQYNAKNLDTVFTMFGLGNGCFVRALADKLQKDNKLIIFEPSISVFRHVIQEYNLEDIIKNENIYLIVQGVNEHELSYIISSVLNWMNLFSHKRCTHPSYDMLFEQIFSWYTDLLDGNAFNNVVAKNTYEKLGKSAVENTLYNLRFLKDTISIWDLAEKLPKNTPVIIAAAGPSLRRNIEELRRAKGYSIIIAVDRAYEIFLEHGIEPDFVIVLDSLKELKYCGNIPGFTTPLLYKFEASPDIIGNHNGKKIVYTFEDFVSNIYQRLGKNYPKIITGGSVTTAAFAAFASLGFERIVLIGCDLAYDGEKTHAGQIQDEMTENYRKVNLYVEDIYGNQIRTRHDWYTFLWWFEGVIVQLKNTDVIDATEAGAKIKGSRIMTLREVIDQYCKVPIDCSIILDETEPSISAEDCVTVYNFLREAKDDLLYIKKEAKRALQYCNTLVRKLNAGEGLTKHSDIIQKVTEINQNVEAKPVYALVNNYVFGEGTNNIRELFFMTNNNKTDDNVAVNNMTRIYHIILEASEALTPKMSDALTYFI